MFSFQFIKGDPEAALSDPMAIVLTRSAAERLFGNEDPVGKTLKVENRFDMTVTAVIEEIPRNSHIRFDVLARFEFLTALWGERMDNWNSFSHITYVQLREAADLNREEEQMNALIKQNMDDFKSRLQLLPVTGIHLASFPQWTDTAPGSMKHVYIFAFAAAGILLIAQFALSAELIICAGIVSTQVNYLNPCNLGFERDNIITMPVTGSLLRKIAPAARELTEYPDIESISFSNTLPGTDETSMIKISWDGKNSEGEISIEIIYADLDFLKTFGIEMVSGAYYSAENQSALYEGYVVNQKMAEVMGYNEQTVLNQRLYNAPRPGKRSATGGQVIGKKFPFPVPAVFPSPADHHIFVLHTG